MEISVVRNKNTQFIFEKVWNLILSFIFLFALNLSLYNYLENKLAFICAGIFSVVISTFLCFLNNKKIHKVLFFSLPALLALIIIVVLNKNLLNGCSEAYNIVIDLIGEAKGTIMSNLKVNEGFVSFDLSVLSIFVINFLALPIVMSINNNKIFAPAVCIIALCVFGIYVQELSLISLGLLFVIFCLLVDKKYSAFDNCNQKGLLLFRTIMLVLALILITCVFKYTGENKVDFLQIINKQVTDKSEEIRYGEDILPQGDFSRVNGFNPKKNPRLEVVMSKPESYYLRGYVGEKYTENCWEQLDNKKLYQNNDLFYWLHKKSFYGQTQLSALANLFDSSSEKNRITVKNISANNKYVYAPYEMLIDENTYLDKNKIGDENILSRGIFPKKSYTYFSLKNQVKNYTLLGERLYDSEKNGDKTVSEYLNNEAHYNNFVYENYLDVPEEVRRVLTGLLGEYNADKKHLDIGTAKEKILLYLTTNMEYNSNPISCDGDFVTSFLQQTKEGYSVHFATAATLMFRYFGIPARYVEGYIVKPENIEGKLDNSAIALDDTNSHAWTEFYQDGVGWIPFETTPEYLDIMEKADDLKGVSVELEDKNQLNDVNKNNDVKSKQGIDEFKLQDDNKTDWTKLFLIIFAIIIFVCLLGLAVLYVLRYKKLKALYKTFEGDDFNICINNIFAYTAYLIAKFDLKNEDFGKSYKKALDILNEAVYSNHSMSKEKRDEVLNFHLLVVDEIKRNRLRIKIFKDKYIDHLYF